jgi:hypothetical protein
MTENRPGARGEHGCNPLPFACEHSVTHGIDAPMHEVQASSRETSFDDSPPQARIKDLPPRDDSVLPLGQPRDQTVHSL